MDIILTTNSPGEVSAWVRPMVKALKKEWPGSKITVFIPPCTFASGRELPVVKSFTEVDCAVGPKAYINYAVFRCKPRDFHPGQKGFVLFLGGDLGHAVLLGKRLNYPVYAYSERAYGYHGKIRLFFVPGIKVYERLKRKGIPEEKLKIVGDLMFDAVKPEVSVNEMERLFGIEKEDFVLNIFPGSRPHELRETLPFFLKSCLQILKKREVKPVVTLAPFITIENIEKVLNAINEFKWELNKTENTDLLVLRLNGFKFWIYRGISYNTMQISHLVLALPGTNNVELFAMQVPVLVTLPLNWPELIPLPGLAGLIAEIPFIGPWLKRRVIIPKILPKFKYVSPVNRNFESPVFPELKGILQPEMVAERVLKIINDELLEIKERLTSIKIDQGIGEKIIKIIKKDLNIQ